MLKKILILYCLLLIPCLGEPQTPVLVKLLMPIPVTAVGAVILGCVGVLAHKAGEKLYDKTPPYLKSYFKVARPLTREELETLAEYRSILLDPSDPRNPFHKSGYAQVREKS